MYPLVVGNLDGVPVALRYRANRIAVSEEVERARERAADHRLSPVERAAASVRADDTERLLKPGRRSSPSTRAAADWSARRTATSPPPTGSPCWCPARTRTSPTSTRPPTRCAR
ncbi:hypothetical protein ACFQ1I_15550 [Kitasatospora arboriphila]